MLRSFAGSSSHRDWGIVTNFEADVSVVIPVYNEEKRVRTAVERVLRLSFVKEVIVVDDGSTDNSRKVLSELSDLRLRVIECPENQGKGAALRRGFAEASSPFIAVHDADLEYDPSEIERLLVPLRDGRADVVFGSRFTGSDEHRVLYYWHSVRNRLLTTLSNMVTNLNLTDMETCTKVFKKEVIQSIELTEDRFGFEPEVTAKVARRGDRIYEVGISYSGRTYAEGKKIGWRDGARAVWVIAKNAPILNRRG
jgi:glycosyltransferase involved in cell wall biosynthesis